MGSVGLDAYTLCNPKCSPWTSSVVIAWELVRNTESQAPPRPAELVLFTGSQGICVPIGI